MKITISPKDTTDKITLAVEFTWQEGEMFCVRFEGGVIRKYPMQHIWYIQFDLE